MVFSSWLRRLYRFSGWKRAGRGSTSLPRTSGVPGNRGRSRLRLEALEDRTMLAVTLSGVPTWVEQGPSPIIGNANILGMEAQGNPAIGAIQAVAAHPTDPDTLYVATVGGGIWRTTNAPTASPSWLNLSDDWPTLATTTIAFNPLDPTRQSLFAGTGSLSSGGVGGLAMGLFRTTTGGFTWQRVSTATLGSKRIRAIVP